MANCRAIIIRLKEVRESKGLSLNNIVSMVEENHDYVSRSSIQRVFAEGSEDVSFKYEETIRPIANALLDIDKIEDTDDENIASMKTLLKFKDGLIGELREKIKHLENELNKEKVRHHEKMDNERAQWARSIEFLKEQVAYKDKRMDILLESIQAKDARYDKLIELMLSCPARKLSLGECDA